MPDPKPHRVEPCPAADLESLVPTFGEAFWDDPMVGYLFPEDDARRRALPWFERLGLRLSVGHGEIFSTPDRAGGAVWLAPGEHRITWGRLAEAGMPQALPHFGFRGMMRLEKLMSHFGEIHDLDAPEPHWYLLILGVIPARQRTGLGSALLQPMLERADREGRDCFLNTMKESNLPFYRRHGFEVVRDAVAPGTSLRFWNMRRAPRGA